MCGIVYTKINFLEIMLKRKTEIKNTGKSIPQKNLTLTMKKKRKKKNIPYLNPKLTTKYG